MHNNIPLLIPATKLDLIIPVYNNLKITRATLSRINKDPFRENINLILVDNGSNKKTSSFLKKNADIYLRSEKNEGFIIAVNKALRITKNDVILLNNDVLIPPGSLNALVNKPLDIVGPLTSRINSKTSKNSQLIKIPYKNISGLNRFFKKINKLNRGTFKLVDYVYFHAVFIKRKVIKKIGLLDERFGLGNYEDLDFCLRAKKQNFKIGIALDSYVHHMCHSTFKLMGVNLKTQLTKNKLIFEEKWRSFS